MRINRLETSTDLVSLSLRSTSDKDPLQKARAAFIASQYEPVFGAWFAYVRSDGGKDQKEFGDFIQALKNFTEKYLPDEYVDRKGFNTADILMGPMIVSISTPMISFVFERAKLTGINVCRIRRK